MGNHPMFARRNVSGLVFEMDDNDSNDSFEGFMNDFTYREHLYQILHYMLNTNSREVFNTAQGNKMPTRRKRPNLTVFRTTQLYREIRALSGEPSDGPINRWSLFKFIQNRENGLGQKPSGSYTANECRRIVNLYCPNNKDQRIMSLESKVFCGKFSKSGNRLVTASQDNYLRIFNSSKGTYHRMIRIPARDVSWCVLDIDFSPNESHFVYSTWSDYLHIVNLNEPSDDFQWLNLRPDNTRSCVFSVRFSPCGRYLISGANDGCIYLCDRLTESRTKKIKSHLLSYTDINAVSYINSSSEMFVSGCDNGIIKLWDLRTLNVKRPNPVGILAGHFDGITYIDSRGDGNYILSNSKDQSIKIWDLRLFSPRSSEQSLLQRRQYNWDYRWDSVPREYYNPVKKLPDDVSVMTYRGHRVTNSLIRAKFSPAEQTGQRYIYTGCGTGRVIVYDVLTGYIKEAIEGHKDIVRDVDWHPVRNEIVSCSWDSHVNLLTYRRNTILKRKHSAGRNSDEPLRRSRRIAMREQAGNV